ncbi:MAG: cupredoxin family copper-binding protein [Abitibacteriaceae bacterium]|nr:cupredoxin family copper-binding protein [Abditibacteriaceae bacterium]
MILNPASPSSHLAIASQKTATASSQKAKAPAAKALAAKAPATKQVTIDNFSFTPATLIVAVGTQVTWINHDDVPHTVKTTNHVFMSQALDTDQQYSYRFTKSGTYQYFCSLHPMMQAKVIVK